MSERRLIQISHVFGNIKQQTMEWAGGAPEAFTRPAQAVSQAANRPTRPADRPTNQPTNQLTNEATRQPATIRAAPSSLGPGQLINCPGRPAICAYAFHSLIIGSKLPGSTRLLMCAFSSGCCCCCCVISYKRAPSVSWHATPSRASVAETETPNNWPDMLLFSLCLFNVLQIKSQMTTNKLNGNWLCRSENTPTRGPSAKIML